LRLLIFRYATIFRHFLHIAAAVLLRFATYVDIAFSILRCFSMPPLGANIFAFAYYFSATLIFLLFAAI